jgi:hypothetical protein
MNYKYYKLTKIDDPKDLSQLSLELHKITGFYACDYLPPVIKGNGQLFTIISDGCEFKKHFCVSLLILPFMELKSIPSLENELVKLVHEYSIENIHFTEIFGQRKLLGIKRNEFIDKYVSIVSKVPHMICLSLSRNKDEILHDLGKTDLTNEMIYTTLFWNNFERIIPAFSDGDVFHIWQEQEDDLDNTKKHKENAEKVIENLYSGIHTMQFKFPDRYISICRYPLFFSKKALLYSSLSDLVAYASNKIQYKIDIGVPKRKIQQEYNILLSMIRKVFINYSGLESKELIELINEST